MVQLETQSVDAKDIANWMELLQLNGVKNYGYNPDDLITSKDHVRVISPEISTNWYPENE